MLDIITCDIKILNSKTKDIDIDEKDGESLELYTKILMPILQQHV